MVRSARNLAALLKTRNEAPSVQRVFGSENMKDRGGTIKIIFGPDGNTHQRGAGKSDGKAHAAKK